MMSFLEMLHLKCFILTLKFKVLSIKVFEIKLKSMQSLLKTNQRRATRCDFDYPLSAYYAGGQVKWELHLKRPSQPCVQPGEGLTGSQFWPQSLP